ncbi:MAG: tetratricopeptide repeat protein [Akkermansiaceae bacterium]|nr:tetratricopeptide repeat protein [Akkermansiaceae bacterium]
MKKWILCAVLAIITGGCWISFLSKGSQMDRLTKEVTELKEGILEADDPDARISELMKQKNGLEAERTFSGILLTFFSAGLIGIVLVSYVIPAMAEKVSHSVYDSGEMMEKDVMHDARSLVAQGNYEGAIQAYKAAAEKEPLNRMPWVEIAKIQKDHLHDPDAAVATIYHALESQEWQVSDAAYFLFRLAELFDEVKGDRAAAIEIMNQVIRDFPDTRHSANATHKLREWSMGLTHSAGNQLSLAAEKERLAREEAEFLAKMKGENS